MRYFAIISASCATLVAFSSSAAAAEHSWDDGGAQPGQSYPGGKKPDEVVVTGGGAQPGQSAPPTPVPPTPPPIPKGVRAYILANGKAGISSNAPLALKQIIQSANQIIGKPYLWGGGHTKWEDRGYDCSGAISYALHGAGLLENSLVSGELMRWGQSGAGRWVTIYAHKTHVYMEIAGIRLDTSWTDDPSKKKGTRWRPLRTHRKNFAVRHPDGL